MDNQERITKPEHKLPPDLWQQLDNIDDSNIERLIESLEKYVSNGFFGAAAELSDSLESYPGLDKNLNWKVRVEQERMKRYYCLGFENLTIASSNRVLNYLKQVQPDNIDKFLICKGTAIGHQGWLTSNTDELQKIIDSCKGIRNNVRNQKDKNERTCFIYALNGRLLHLQKEYTKANQCFEEAITMAEAVQNCFLRSAAHIKIIYAEHLVLQKKWEKVVTYANEFLLDAAQLQFKTHLLIRAFILLLQAPNKYLKNQEKDFQHYVFRYQILLHAMGLSQSQELNPILAKAKELIPGKEYIDLYYVDWRTELRKRIMEIAEKKNQKNQKTGEGFEKLIKMYYELLNYQVFKLPDNFCALDLIAIYSSPHGEKTFTGIQIKSGNEKITKTKDLTDYSGNLLEAKNELETGKYTEGIKVKPISSIHWYSIKDFNKYARDALARAVKYSIGEECFVETTHIDKLINTLLSKAEILVRIIFSKELDIE